MTMNDKTNTHVPPQWINVNIFVTVSLNLSLINKSNNSHKIKVPSGSHCQSHFFFPLQWLLCSRTKCVFFLVLFLTHFLYEKHTMLFYVCVSFKRFL